MSNPTESAGEMMTDHPILFSSPMVRALLKHRKTMTRRLSVDGKGRPSRWRKCKIGDLLWVRETHYRFTGCQYKGHPWDGFIESPDGDPYQARCCSDYPDLRAAQDRCAVVKMPSIYMPRWASRLTLEVTAVRIEPLQNILWNGDAEREGIYDKDRDPVFPPWTWSDDAYCYETPAYAFRALWISLHGETSWADNPDVVVISFRVHNQNIDTFKQRVPA